MSKGREFQIVGATTENQQQFMYSKWRTDQCSNKHRGRLVVLRYTSNDNNVSAVCDF